MKEDSYVDKVVLSGAEATVVIGTRADNDVLVASTLAPVEVIGTRADKDVLVASKLAAVELMLISSLSPVWRMVGEA